MKYCGNCGESLEGANKFCTHCGAPIEARSKDYEVKIPKKHELIVVSVCALALVILTACVFVILHDDKTPSDDVAGLNGTYMYVTEGQSSTHGGFRGTWTIEFSNGNCINSNLQINPSMNAGRGVGISLTSPISSHPLGYVDKLLEINRCLIKYEGSLEGYQVYDGNIAGTSVELHVEKTGVIQKIIWRGAQFQGEYLNMVFVRS